VFTPPGKLIAIEGIDGSGKRTQLDLLAKALTGRGVQIQPTAFPHYDSWFGKMVGRFLNGDFGALDSVDPHFAALLYAGDRFEAKRELSAALEQGKVVLADRYIASNLAHQTARLPTEKRNDFIAWLEHLEYNIYGLPRESLILYLRVPPHEAQRLITLKAARSYTSAQKDLQEASFRHLQDAAEMYDSLSRSTPWATIQCFDAMQGAMREPEEIAVEVLAAVEGALSSARAGEGR